MKVFLGANSVNQQQLKQALQKAPILIYPKSTKSYTVKTDASLFGIAAIFFQKQQWGERVFVIAYASKTLKKQSTKLLCNKTRTFCGNLFTQHFKIYLLGQKFLILKDHWVLT